MLSRYYLYVHILVILFNYIDECTSFVQVVCTSNINEWYVLILVIFPNCSHKLCVLVVCINLMY